MRLFPKIVAAASVACVVALAAAGDAAAQEKSTWQRIMETKVMRLGAPVSEPFHFKDPSGNTAPGAVKSGDTVWRGVTPNVAKELADALGVELQIVETTYGTAIAGLQANQFDLIFALDGTPKRAAAVDFVPSPLFWYGTAVLAKTDANIESWKAIDDQKMKVGLPTGTTMEMDMTKRAPGAQLSKFQTVPEMIAAFQSGRVDAISLSLTGMTLTSARLPGTKVRMPEPAALYPVGCAIRQETDPRWRNFLQTAIQYLATSGFVQNALNQAYEFRGVDITKVQPVVIK